MTAALILALLPPVGAVAQPLSLDPSECEIQAALLGSASPDCPPPKRLAPPPAPTAAPAPKPAAPKPAPAPAAQAVAPVPVPPVPMPEAPALRADFRIGFALNSARITAESRGLLDRIAAVMAKAGDTRFRVVGHTDARGSAAANRTLSRRRAEAVADYLASRGVARARLEPEGVGSGEPLEGTDPRAAGNRRVEIVNLGD